MNVQSVGLVAVFFSFYVCLFVCRAIRQVRRLHYYLKINAKNVLPLQVAFNGPRKHIRSAVEHIRR